VTSQRALTATSLALDLGPGVASCGFVLGEYEAVISELRALPAQGMPERAVPKRQAEFLAGRLAASHALARLGSSVLPGRHSEGHPVWPAGIVGSITHGARRAFCAVAHDSDVRSLGIDAEGLMGPDASEGVRSKICTRAERELVRQSFAMEDHVGVTLAFSAKESLYKCLYPLVRRFIDFHAVAVVGARARSSEGRSGELELVLNEDVSPAFQHGSRFRAVFALAASHVETAVLLVNGSERTS